MKNKCNLWSVAVCWALMTGSCLQAQEKSNFTFRGYMADLPDSIRVDLVNAENEKMKLIGDTIPSNGAFVLQGHVGSPTFCRLRFRRFSPKRKEYVTIDSVNLMLEEGETKFRCDVPFDSLGNSYQPELLVKITGGTAEKEYDEALRATAENALKAKLAGYKEAEKYFASNADPDTVRKYLALTREAEDAHWQARRNFILEHPAYHISAYWVEKELEKQFVYDEKELRTLVQAVKVCPDTVRVARLNRKLERAVQYATGRKFVDFEATSPHNNKKMFSDVWVPGQYMLIDFWASWCGPCRAAIPRVAQLYKEYENKLKVCSVSLDEKEADWRKALEKEKMPWVQLWTNAQQVESVCKAYQIASIPRLILLNDKGEIICSTFRPDDVVDCLKQHLNP